MRKIILPIVLLVLASSSVGLGTLRLMRMKQLESFPEKPVSTGPHWTYQSVPPLQWPDNPGCGAVRQPIPVWHHDHIAFWTRYRWCSGDMMLAVQALYSDGTSPRQGSAIVCEHGDVLTSVRELSYTEGGH